MNYWDWFRIIAALVLLGGAILLHPDSRAGELYLEVGVGHDRHIDEGRNPQGIARLRYEMQTPAWWTPDVIELDHHSSIQNGWPFNRQPEDLTDQASLIWRFKIK